jgi:DNA-binding NarL/FixJ family response regulator
MESIIGSNGNKISPGIQPSLLNGKALDDKIEIEIGEKRGRSLVLVDNRELDRECLAQGIGAYKPGMDVFAFGTLDEWKRVKDQIPPPAALLLHIGGKDIADQQVGDEIRRLVAEFKTAPVIVLANSDRLTQILKALECGARGYIPSNVSIRVCAEVIELTLAGGIFVPASSVLAVRQILETSNEIAQPLAGLFTLRQAEVVEALRRGKANKIIAYELNLRESTVKVHIRNIMKKLKATNRTEVAFKLRDLFPSGSS